ncbi:MAG: hypothetical protein ACREA3_06960 [Nitrosotalea sp.]
MNGILCPQCEPKLGSGPLTKTIVSGIRTRRFPIGVDKVIAISRDIRKIELVVEFERK